MSEDRIVQIMPADGWVEITAFKQDDGSWKTEVWPLVGWALRESGSIGPISTDTDGFVSEAGGQAIWHPDIDGPWSFEQVREYAVKLAVEADERRAERDETVRPMTGEAG